MSFRKMVTVYSMHKANTHTDNLNDSTQHKEIQLNLNSRTTHIIWKDVTN